MGKNRIFILLGFVILVITGCTLNSSDDSLAYTGSVEAKEVIVKSQMNGEIIEEFTVEGQRIEANDLIVKIDTQGLAFNLKDLEIAKEIAELTLADLSDGIEETSITLKESEVNVINEEISAQKRVVEYSKEQFEKNEKLYNSEALSEELLSASELTYNQNLDRLDILYQRRTVAQNAKKSLENTTTDQVKQKAEKNIASLNNQIDQLNYEIDKSNIESPINGIIQKKYVEVGEFITMGEPLSKIIDPKDKHLIIYVPEKNISKIQLGQKIKFSDEFVEKEAYGRIDFISEKAEFTPKNVSSKESKQELVFKTKIKIHNSSIIKPGMYLTVNLLGD
jgi:HlyD family secretion protein